MPRGPQPITVPDALADAYRQGELNATELAKRLGCCAETALRALRRAGVDTVRRHGVDRRGQAPNPRPVPSEVQRIFGERLRALRAARGWTQLELAQAAGLHTTHVSYLESGEHVPTWAVACRLADALGCRLDDFRE